jgi:hypothetical protein
MTVTIKLTEQTIFPELNRKEGKNEDYARDFISIESLRYKHIRAALKYPDQEQLHQLMMMLTGLSEVDVGELLPQDAAKVGSFLQQEISKFNQLSQDILTHGNKN